MNGEGEQTLRQKKLAATTLNIEKNAVALVLKHGLEAVTVNMICESSGVSQRTFFNYFKTKHAAILGASVPRVDERRAREFVAASGGNLLVEALRIVNLGATDTKDPEFAAARVRLISESPVLFQKQMERFSAVRADLEDILYLRLRKTARATDAPERTREEASLATQMLAGVFRFAAERQNVIGLTAGASPVDHTAELLNTVLPRLIENDGKLRNNG